MFLLPKSLFHEQQTQKEKNCGQKLELLGTTLFLLFELKGQASNIDRQRSVAFAYCT